MGELIGLEKAPTGIAGLDELTGGGLPRGRAALVCGEAGCGKSLLALKFLVRVATQFSEPGVLMAFEDTTAELAANVARFGFDLPRLARQERWLKQKGVSSIRTGERDDGMHTRHGLDEYVSDCGIVLDHRVTDELSTCTLRKLKFRGTKHGTNEYSFLIDDHGISIMPDSSLGLNFEVSTERVPSGIDRLDAMLNGGAFRGSSVLISGTAGTGKTSIVAHYADTCRRQGKRCAFFSFEEAPAQLVRNVRPIGLDLAPWTEQGILCFFATRPTQHGREAHLAILYRTIDQFRPSMVVIDPITSFTNPGRARAIRSMPLRLVDYLKSHHITAIFTSLTSTSDAPETSDVGISSLIDTWILLQILGGSGERNRGLDVLSSRGMAHSNQIREFLTTDRGLELVDVMTSPSGFVTGAARQALDKAQILKQEQELEARNREFERRREAQKARLQALCTEFAVEVQVHLRSVRPLAEREEDVALDRCEQLEARFSDDSTRANISPTSSQRMGPCSAKGTGDGESWTRNL